MVGHDGQNIEAYALREAGFIQQSVALHLRQRFGNTLLGNGFQFEMHNISYLVELLNTRNSFDSGSKKRSTTRSLSGMIALSVIVMFSGQTSVQHFVMLQSPMPPWSFRNPVRSSPSIGCISSPAMRTKKRGPANWLFSSCAR